MTEPIAFFSLFVGRHDLNLTKFELSFAIKKEKENKVWHEM